MARSRTLIELHLQDAGAPGGYLLEELLKACDGADRGGGMFAWANRQGTRLLLEDPTFAKFSSAGPFELVVGMDSITDSAALERLEVASDALSGLTVRAFVHEGSGLFHPKFSWFADSSGLTLIVGSGNLTGGGLTGNWEAFTTTRVTGDAAEKVENQISNWLAAQHARLFPLDDPRVVELGKRNTGRERDLKRLRKVPPPAPVGPQDGFPILVAEIPAGDRWKQANFDKENYEGFFGAKVGTQRRIRLHHVGTDGALADVESRPSVEVASQNYRFELAAATGVPYPTKGRPIGVFVRLETGSFIYRLVLPADPGYAAVDGFLGAHSSGPSHHLRRVRTSVASLRAAWPDSPLWNASVAEL